MVQVDTDPEKLPETIIMLQIKFFSIFVQIYPKRFLYTTTRQNQIRERVAVYIL